MPNLYQLKRNNQLSVNIHNFREDVTNEHILKTLTLATSVMLRSKNWKLNYRMYYQQNGEQFFKILAKCCATSLKLIDNNCHQIIKHVSNVEFANLKQLQINRNNILSIESLQLIDFPQLTILRLDSNHIYSIQSLRKVRCPKLQHLQIDKNIIKQMRPINELQCPLLRKLYIQYSSSLISQDEGIEWLFKLQCPKIQNISLKSPNRIKLNNLTSFILLAHPLLENMND